MPRANRHYIPGCVWHITHRCHKKEFLLKFARDRRRYLQWLFEAKKRFGLSELNYMVTSNHIHLLVRDIGERDVIPNSIQLIAGRTGQEYNQRRDRKGAYWEDRYHATALSPSTRNESSAGIRGKRSENGREPPGLCKSVGMRHDVAYLSLLR